MAPVTIDPEPLILYYFFYKKRADEQEIMTDLYNIRKRLKRKKVKVKQGYAQSRRIKNWDPRISRVLSYLSNTDIITVDRKKRNLTFHATKDTSISRKTVNEWLNPRVKATIMQVVKKYVEECDSS